MKTFSAKPIPQYEGQWCTSACYNDYDCPHEELFDEELGIRRVEVKWSDNGKMIQKEEHIWLK